ncbi:hypothetical protein KAU51_02030 [Candidatus Parcubacteria bacterium]|nr:hypothetical protein [Candidatus Parcubacteria bacterium]
MKKIIYLIIILLILSFVLPQITLGIGQLTKPIIIKDVLRGQEVTAILKLFNSGDKEVTYQFKANGDIKEWASFYEIEDKNLENAITEIQIPAESSINAVAKFTVPEDTPNGDYSGEVAIVSIPVKDKETGKIMATVFQRVGRKVSITVTDEEIIKFDATIIPLKYGIGKNEPLRIKVIYDNQGNVAIRPDIQLKILKSNETIFNAIFPYPEDEKAVRPFERKVFENLIEWPTAGQENGRYRAEVKVLLNGEMIEEDDFRFIVGFDWSKFLASIAVIGGGNIVLAWFIIGGVLAMLAGILAAFYKKPQFFKAGIQRIKSIL